MGKKKEEGETAEQHVLSPVFDAIQEAIDDPATTPVLAGKLKDAVAALSGYNAAIGEKTEQAAADQQEAAAIIADLKKQLEKATDAKASASKKPTVKHEGVTYEVNSGAHGHGTAAEIAKKPESVKAILKIEGQTILTKV